MKDFSCYDVSEGFSSSWRSSVGVKSGLRAGHSCSSNPTFSNHVFMKISMFIEALLEVKELLILWQLFGENHYINLMVTCPNIFDHMVYNVLLTFLLPNTNNSICLCPKVVLTGILQGGSVDASYPFDCSSSSVIPGVYIPQDSLFRYLVHTFTENHLFMRKGVPWCPGELNKEWTKVQGDDVCTVVNNFWCHIATWCYRCAYNLQEACKNFL